MEMGSRNTRPILYSVLALCICTALIVGGTYALFTDTVKVNNHLSAGNLTVGLDRILYKQHVLADNGLMTDLEDKTVLDLTNNANKIFNVEKAVPTSKYEATIRVSNNTEGSTAFAYKVKILWSPNKDATDNDEALAAQLKITVTSTKLANGSVSFYLDKCADHVMDMGYLLKGTDVDTFTVTALFEDGPNNDAAQNAALEFDVQVEAVQITELPPQS